jgi:hypothetical protein
MPVALLISLLFHRFIRDTFIVNLPAYLRRRFSSQTSFQWAAYLHKNWHIFMLSVLIGMLTHLLWDQVLHRIGDPLDASRNFDVYFMSWKVAISFYTVLHIINSVAGLFVIALAIGRMPEKTEAPTNRFVKYYWIGILLCTAIVVAIRTRLFPIHNNEDFMVTAISGFLLALLLISIIYGRKVRVGQNKKGL